MPRPPQAQRKAAGRGVWPRLQRHADLGWDGAERLDLGHDARHLVGEALALGGAGVEALQSCRLDAQVGERPAQEDEAPQGLHRLDAVVAVLRPAAGHDHRVGALGEALEDELGLHAPGAHQADEPDVVRVLGASRAGQVGRSVAAPVAGEAQDERLEGLAGDGRRRGLGSGRWCGHAVAPTASSAGLPAAPRGGSPAARRSGP